MRIRRLTLTFEDSVQLALNAICQMRLILNFQSCPHPGTPCRVRAGRSLECFDNWACGMLEGSKFKMLIPQVTSPQYPASVFSNMPRAFGGELCRKHSRVTHARMSLPPRLLCYDARPGHSWRHSISYKLLSQLPAGSRLTAGESGSCILTTAPGATLPVPQPPLPRRPTSRPAAPSSPRRPPYPVAPAS